MDKIPIRFKDYYYLERFTGEELNSLVAKLENTLYKYDTADLAEQACAAKAREEYKNCRWENPADPRRRETEIAVHQKAERLRIIKEFKEDPLQSRELREALIESDTRVRDEFLTHRVAEQQSFLPKGRLQ